MSEMMVRLCRAALRASRVDDLEATDDEIEAIVRAVLTELREPTQAMVEASGEHAGIGPHSSREVFAAMIDAALTPTPTDTAA